MTNTNKSNGRIGKEPSSASSTSKIVVDNLKRTDGKSLKKHRTSDGSISQSSNDASTIRGPLAVTRVLIILWYVCICLLFVIAFLALVLSVLYFLTDSSTEQVIKLYGITGSGSLAVVAFVIIFLDCCNDGDRDDHEEEAIYRILQFKEKKDEKAVKRQHRRVIIKKEEPSVGQPQRSQSLPKSLPPAHHHHHHYPQPSHIHHIHAHTSGFYHHPHSFSHYRYPYDAHHHHHHRHHQSDVGVDTSDRLETILKSKGTIRKPMRNAQTAPKTEDIEHGTQTSTTDFDGKSNNTLEIAKEIPAPEKTANPLPTLKEKSIEQPEKDFPITRTISELNPPLLPKV